MKFRKDMFWEKVEPQRYWVTFNWGWVWNCTFWKEWKNQRFYCCSFLQENNSKVDHSWENTPTWFFPGDFWDWFQPKSRFIDKDRRKDLSLRDWTRENPILQRYLKILLVFRAFLWALDHFRFSDRHSLPSRIRKILKDCGIHHWLHIQWVFPKLSLDPHAAVKTQWFFAESKENENKQRRWTSGCIGVRGKWFQCPCKQ